VRDIDPAHGGRHRCDQRLPGQAAVRVHQAHRPALQHDGVERRHAFARGRPGGGLDRRTTRHLDSEAVTVARLLGCGDERELDGVGVDAPAPRRSCGVQRRIAGA